MAENIIRLIEYPELAKSMGMKGKTNIKNNFFIEKHLEIIQNILAEAIQSKNN
jgi:glycosyltransferase involved in cell wall biosynthesis